MNILYITHRLPYPPDKGDRIRNWHVLRWLARHGDVSLATLTDEPIPDESREMLGRTAARFAAAPVDGPLRKLRALKSLAAGRSLSEGMFHSPALMRNVRGWARETPFDLAFCSASSVAGYLKIPELTGAVRCVDIVDVDSQKWRDYADASSGPKRWLYALEGRRVAKLERAICAWADGAVLVSDNETDLLRRDNPGSHASILTASNGVDLEYFAPRPPTENPTNLAFVGAFDYKPNIDGAIWFCRRIYPALREKYPNLNLQLVGRNPTPAVRQLGERPGVEVVGTVPDVRPYVAASLAVIAPLRIARGLQNKVLEALAMGKSVVASPAALGGFRPEDGVPALVADLPDEWVASIGRLISDADYRNDLGERGRRHAEAYHDWNNCLEPLTRFVREPAEARTPTPPMVGVRALAGSS